MHLTTPGDPAYAHVSIRPPYHSLVPERMKNFFEICIRKEADHSGWNDAQVELFVPARLLELTKNAGVTLRSPVGFPPYAALSYCWFESQWKSFDLVVDSGRWACGIAMDVH
ncbi:hypothetical protein PSPO01_06751 [Paraphaeosphaeria sporulosa]